MDRRTVPLDEALQRPAISVGGSASESLEQLFLGALKEGPAGVTRLLEWGQGLEEEGRDLRRRLRKQEFDFTTLFEIVGQTSARSLNVDSMQTYLLRTVSGHFTTTRLLVYRRPKEEDTTLSNSASQGLRNVNLDIPVDSLFGREALRRRFCMLLRDLPPEVRECREVVVLLGLGIELAVPLIQEVETPNPVLEGFLFLGSRLANRAYERADQEFLNTLGKMLAICLRNEALYHRSIVDDLTGVASRGHFEARLSQEINRIEIYSHRSLGLVMLDVDEFKRFNDAYGHPTGDRVLRELAKVLVQQVRNVDLVARYGGEEFAVILLEIDRRGLLEVAHRLREAIERLRVRADNDQILKITASFGAACYPDDAGDKTELIQVTDQALYRAKEQGRNRVVLATRSGDRLGTATAKFRAPIPVQPPQIDRRRPSDRLPRPKPESGGG